MKQFGGFEAKKAGGAREILPAGGYVCEIKNAKVEEYKNGEFTSLVLAIEIAEGPMAGFWKKDFDNNDREDKKWRGRYAVSVPKDDGSEQDGWTKRIFGNFIWAVQESNPGFVWDWDEKKLKGKKVGIIYRNREWEYNGNSGWTTEAGGAASIEDVRTGNYRPLKDKPLKNKPAAADSNHGFDTVDDESDLPF